MVFKTANVFEFLHGGPPHWGPDFKVLFDTAYSTAWNGQYASDTIFQGEEVVIGAWNDSEPVGLAIVCENWHDSNTPYLMMIFVKEQHRRTGIASLLVDKITDLCKCTASGILGAATTSDGMAFASKKLPHIPFEHSGNCMDM